MYLGLLAITEEIRDKLHTKHSITFDDVVEAIQWPARAEAAWDDDPNYGPRLVVMGSNAAGRRVICYLKPLPEWDDNADTWDIKTARWVD